MHALYPHLKGRTSLAYSDCGKYLLTVGENMMARRFVVGAPQEEPETVELAYNGVAVIANRNFFAICGDSGTAELFDLETRDKISTLARTALPLRSISLSSDGEWVAVAGDDFARVVGVKDITQTRPVPFENVRHLVFHPLTPSILAVSTLDSTVRVYDLQTQNVLGEIEVIVPAVTDFGDTRSTAAAWSPSGECFALPTKTFDIAMVSTRDWLVAFRLSNGHSNAITALAWSPNGRFLASAGRDDKIIVWDVESRSIVRIYEVAEPLEVRWHPHHNELSFVTGRGQLYTTSGVIPDSLHPPFGGDPLDPLASIPTSVLAGGRDLGDDDADEAGLFVSDDDDVLDSSNSPRVSHSHGRGHSHSHDHVYTHAGRKRQRLDFSATPQQIPFQSGSTPWLRQKRFLCTSPIGYVWSVRHSDTHQSTTITFFDQSVHREVHFRDTDQFDMAALTPQACLLANSDTGKIAVRFHSSLSDNWDTSVDLAVDGGVQCVALSSEVAVVFTRSGFMRSYTLYGTPLAVTCVGSGYNGSTANKKGGSDGSSSVVTCSAHGNEVLAVYQQSGAYTYTYEDVARGKVFQSQCALGITPGSKLAALFFSEEGEPFVMDSKGMLTTLLHGRLQGQARWVPMLGSPDAVENEIQKRYWPIGVHESKLLCVVLKGQQQYPSIPIPITDEIDLSTPGLPDADAKYLVARTQHEQLQDRIEYLTDQLGVEPDEELQDSLTDSAIELDKMLLRQFQHACQDQRLNRGLQIVQLIHSPESMQAAAKVAAAYELTTLASRILEAVE